MADQNLNDVWINLWLLVACDCGSLRHRREKRCFSFHPHNSSPLIRPAATFSPDLGGEGTLFEWQL